MVQSKLNLIRAHCKPLIGQKIERFETAEIRLTDGTWEDWPDLPLRIYCTKRGLVSIAWSKFDDLWLSNNESTPFPIEEDKTRWRRNRHAKLDPAIGQHIKGVMIGRGDMTINSQEIEVWSRLLFELADMWLEVFNALDENAYDLHRAKPNGKFRKCI